MTNGSTKYDFLFWLPVERSNVYKIGTLNAIRRLDIVFLPFLKKVIRVSMSQIDFTEESLYFAVHLQKPECLLLSGNEKLYLFDVINWLYFAYLHSLCIY